MPGPETDTGDVAFWRAQSQAERARADALLNLVIPIGVALTTEKDLARLLERILIEAQTFCAADSGSLYLLSDDRAHLEFAMVRNQTLGLAMGGTTGTPITFPGVPLHDPVTGAPNKRYMAVYAALTGETIHIPDTYAAVPAPEGSGLGFQFDFSGTRGFDARTGYRSVSLLTVPLIRADGTVIGVLQLINAVRPGTKEIIPFEPNMQQILEVLGRLAAVALEGYLREQRLSEQVRQLRIEIDQTKKARQVAEITDTDYFRELRQKSRQLRDRQGS
jgi:GAF domain-containing protein